MDDRDYVAEDSDNDDDIRRGENENMDDLGEEESDNDENDNDDDDDDDEDESDDGITSDDDEEEEDEEEVDNEIVETFILTFHNGDYDVEFEDKLSYDRGIIYYMPTNASYIKPDDWQDRNRIGLEKAKEQLQSNIHNMVSHHDKINLILSHNCFPEELMDNTEPIVWHEPILQEYWDRIEMYWRNRLGIVNTLQFVNVEVKKERLAALAAIFSDESATTSIVNFNFTNTNLCQEGIVWLSKLVDVSSKLQYFNLQHNRIDDIDSARCLSRALKLSGTCMSRLHVSHCDLGSSPEILSVLLQSDVEWIILENNNIDSLGLIKIVEYLEGNPPIKHLSLDHNRLTDDDAILISQALKRNTNLRYLDLEGNNLTSIGVKVLLTSVYDSSSLNSMSECNHTLVEMGLIDPYVHMRRHILVGQLPNRNNKVLTGCIDNLLQLDQTEKILLAMQDKDLLLKYLANVPVELIPKVLAFFHERIVDEYRHKHLTVVFSTMRWWNMPLLYSYNKRKRKARNCGIHEIL